jgi:hypothetical protein
MTAPRSSSGLRRWLAPLLAALVPLGGTAELVAQRLTATRAPSFSAWGTIVEPVRRLRQVDDLVLVAPRWAEPLARQALGDELMPMADLGRPDLSRYRTALELSILGQRSAELAGWRELSRERQGQFELRRLANPEPKPVTLDFVDALGPDRVEVSFGPGAEPCRWSDRARVLAGGLGGHPTFGRERFLCPGGEFFNVGVTLIADQDFLPRRCIWAHPPQRGELRIRYRDVTLGDVIAGHGGMYWMVERELAGKPVKLEVRVDGEPVGEVVHRDGDGWSSFELPLGAHARAPAAEVEFAVSSADYRDRHFCFEAHTR